MTTAGAEMVASPKAKIREYLGKVARNLDLDDDADIFETGIVSSLFAVELVSFTEQEFGIAVEDDDLDLRNFRSINALAAFVERKTNSRGSSE
jgi:acyl carrier protein